MSRINGRLPEDIIILGQAVADDSFNARHQTVSREYHFYFDSTGLDVQKMEEAAKHLVGKHDFQNFCKQQPVYQKSGTVRIIYEAEVVELEKSKSGEVEFSFSRLRIRGSGFLWHQVKFFILNLLFISLIIKI